MIWDHTWPFNSRSHALAHEQAYLTGNYRPNGSRPILLVTKDDLRAEQWLEIEGAERLRSKPDDHRTIREVYRWKMRATVEAAGGCAEPPAGILSPQFANALTAVLRAQGEHDVVASIGALTAFQGIAVRSASAFVYWLRPSEFQVIDQRATSALNLHFLDEDYTVDNYLRYCALSRELSKQHDLTLRQVDRALFVFQKLLDGSRPTRIPTT